MAECIHIYLLSSQNPSKITAKGNKGHKFIRTERVGDDRIVHKSYQNFALWKTNRRMGSVTDKSMLKFKCHSHQGEISKQAS